MPSGSRRTEKGDRRSAAEESAHPRFVDASAFDRAGRPVLTARQLVNLVRESR